MNPTLQIPHSLALTPTFQPHTSTPFKPYTPHLIMGFLLVASLLVSACQPQQITVTPQPERNVLTVSGEGEFYVNPDKVELTVAIVTNASTAVLAQQKNKDLSNAVIAAFAKAGIHPEDIETVNYDLRQMYGYREKTGERVDQGYTLEHQIKVTSKKIEDSGSLVDLAVTAGANRVDSISFGLTHELERQAKIEALAKASKEATVKAQAVAANIGVTLGKVVKASETASYTPYYPAYKAMYAAEYAGAPAAPTVVSPKKLTISATVTVDYELK